MSVYFIGDGDFKAFLANLIGNENVYGPVAKQTKFVFAELKKPEDLRLDYDVTLLPPKKFFFPPEQKLISFDGRQYKDEVDPKPLVLFGVHFYDIKGLDMTDYLFEENNRDINYLAYREAATVVGSNVQTVAERAFWGTIGKNIKPKGHDAFLTRVEAGKDGKPGYVFEVRTSKGSHLLKYGTFREADQSEIDLAHQINDDVMDTCNEKLNHDPQALAVAVRKSYGNEELWTEIAKDCFSCGTCNTVCPTCYCFDVRDKWNLDQKSGVRNRYWDACLTIDFAAISLGSGQTENFRDKRGERFRHRIMRKGAYLNDKLGGPACVGCGRCSAACTADIADPVVIYDKIMEAHG